MQFFLGVLRANYYVVHFTFYFKNQIHIYMYSKGPVSHIYMYYSKTCLKRPLKKTKIGFQDRLSLNAGQKYCRMVPLEHSAILSTFIKLAFVIKIFVLFIFKLPLKTGFIVTLYAK